MIILIELLSISILVLILWALYHDERIVRKKIRNRATLEKYWDGRERRRHVRFTVDVEISYKEILKSQQQASGARSVDLSDTGMRLLVDRKMPPGTILSLNMTPGRTQKPIEIEGLVVWCTEAKDKEDLNDKRLFHIGLKIVSVRETSGSTFDDYLQTLESDLRTGSLPSTAS